MKHIIRRILATLLILGALAAVIYIDRQGGQEAEGAQSALVSLAGFPQADTGNRISTSWFCPGAAAGDGLDGAAVTISNPGDTEITASLSLLSSEAPVHESFAVPARSQKRIDLLRGRTVGVVAPVVEIIGSVGSVEQSLVYAAGDTTSQCVSQTSNTWYFADGFTAEGSSERLVLINPFPESAVVNVAFTTAAGRRTPASLQGVILAPESSKSISMSESGATNESKVGLEVIATTGQVVASRMQHYLGGGRLGYSATVGIPEPLTAWWFTSGRTGSTVTEQIVVFNTSDTAAQVNITFFGEGITNGVPIDQQGGPALPSQAVDIPAGEIVSINTDNIADLPKGDHAMLVSSLGNARLVVEHVLSQRTNNSAFTAITNGIPSELVSTRWVIPSGLSNGALNALSVLNTTAVDGTFTVSVVGPGGEVALPELTNIPLTSAALANVAVPASLADGEVSITASIPVAVQRRLTRGHGLVGFGIVGALPVRIK